MPTSNSYGKSEAEAAAWNGYEGCFQVGGLQEDDP